jgi:hypothetical protein
MKSLTKKADALAQQPKAEDKSKKAKTEKPKRPSK